MLVPLRCWWPSEPGWGPTLSGTTPALALCTAELLVCWTCVWLCVSVTTTSCHTVGIMLDYTSGSGPRGQPCRCVQDRSSQVRSHTRLEPDASRTGMMCTCGCVHVWVCAQEPAADWLVNSSPHVCSCLCTGPMKEEDVQTRRLRSVLVCVEMAAGGGGDGLGF